MSDKCQAIFSNPYFFVSQAASFLHLVVALLYEFSYGVGW